MIYCQYINLQVTKPFALYFNYNPVYSVVAQLYRERNNVLYCYGCLVSHLSIFVVFFPPCASSMMNEVLEKYSVPLNMGKVLTIFLQSPLYYHVTNFYPR